VGVTTVDRRELLADALDRWRSADGLALAWRDGAAVDAVVAEVARTYPDRVATPVERDRLRIRLTGAIGESLRSPAAQPSQRRVNDTVGRTRRVVDERVATVLKREASSAAGWAVTKAANRTARRYVNETLEEVPAGLPVLPAPGHWYVTTNVWHVQVRGEYERFAVRARRGTPGSGAGTVAYVRDGSTARLDVDGDGIRERLGRADRVSFAADTVVVVVVPPGKAGIGDKDGNADERSAGWPRPGRSGGE
jgi:hypothetical protein